MDSLTVSAPPSMPAANRLQWSHWLVLSLAGGMLGAIAWQLLERLGQARGLATVSAMACTGLVVALLRTKDRVRTPLPGTAGQYMLRRGDHWEGPYTLAELGARYRMGSFGATDEVCRVGHWDSPESAEGVINAASRELDHALAERKNPRLVMSWTRSALFLMSSTAAVSLISFFAPFAWLYFLAAAGICSMLALMMAVRGRIGRAVLVLLCVWAGMPGVVYFAKLSAPAIEKFVFLNITNESFRDRVLPMVAPELAEPEVPLTGDLR